MKKLTLKWLQENNACEYGQTWFTNQKETSISKILVKLAKEDYWSWAYWLLCRVLSPRNRVLFAVFSAKQVRHLYSAKYPNDPRVEEAIKAAENWAKKPTEENRLLAKDAANAAYAAANAAYAAANAANAAYAAANAAANAANAAYAAANAANAAYAAANAASAAYYAAYAAANAAANAANAAYAAASAARKKVRQSCLKFGLKLLTKQK